MQGMQQDRMYSNQDLSNFQSEGQSIMESPLPLQYQRQQDLQLLIRAHEKIRNLQQENFRLIQQKQSMRFELVEEKQKSKNLLEENEKLRTQIDELYSRIGKFQKQFNCQYDLVTEQTQQKDVNRIRKFSHSSRKQSTDIQVNSYENIQPKEPSKRTQKQSNRSLKPSESTPVILNINVNTISKDQRQNFLSSCKEEFAQELEKMNQRESSIKKSLNRNRSEYFEINYQPRTNSQNKHGVSSFLKQAKKQFETQASRNLKNNCYVERNKSTSSGSLIKKNLSKDLLGDRTNYVNSKYASVNQIMSHNAAKNSYLTKNSNYHLRLGSAHDYSSIQRHNGEISKNIYCSKDKRTDVIDRKKKQFEMDLRNQNSGFIKYRGLCL